MGSWSETCVITNTPIRRNHNVKMVLFKPLLTKDHQNYDGHVNRMVTHFDLLMKCFVNIYTGAYDDYGGLKQLPREEFEDNHKYFFIHDDVWNNVVSYVQSRIDTQDVVCEATYKDFISRFDYELDCSYLSLDNKQRFLDGEFKELLYVLAFMEFARKYAWIGDQNRGKQFYCYREHALIAEQIQSVIARRGENNISPKSKKIKVDKIMESSRSLITLLEEYE